MCLIVFDWQPDKNECLTLASNRDEFYARESLSAHFWEDHPSIFGGRDCEMNGTWLAVSSSGRIAAVTNYRAPDNNDYQLSRGEIPLNFLASSRSGEEYVEDIKTKKYAGYNGLLFDGKELIYTSNRSEKQTALKLGPGQYGLSNHLLDTPWPKVVKAKSALAKAMTLDETEQRVDYLFTAMANQEPAPDHLLPITGIPVEFEKMVSPIFIKSPSYGTRTSTILTMKKSEDSNQLKSLKFHERQYEVEKDDFVYEEYDLTIS